MWINEPIDIAGKLLPGASIKAGTQSGASLSADGGITLPANGLEGRIILNADNAPSTGWDGDVTVGGTTLAPTPYYSDLSANLGGGAVGLAPFTFHETDSVPEHASLRTISANNPLDEAVIAHYGPVTFDLEPGEKPYIVEERTSGVWYDVTSSYQFQIDPQNSRNVIATGPFAAGHRYRFIPEPGRVLCDELLTSADVPVDYAQNITNDVNCPGSSGCYWFATHLLVDFDLNGDGVITSADATHWMSEPQDINGDGTADEQDFAALLDEIAAQS